MKRLLADMGVRVDHFAMFRWRTLPPFEKFSQIIDWLKHARLKGS